MPQVFGSAQLMFSLPLFEQFLDERMLQDGLHHVTFPRLNRPMLLLMLVCLHWVWDVNRLLLR